MSIRHGAALARLLRSAFAALLLAWVSAGAHAAITDCKQMSIDGQVDCVKPTYSAFTYWVSDVYPAYGQHIMWDWCDDQPGLAPPYVTEGAVIAYADCFDRRAHSTSPNPKGVTGPLSWAPIGSSFTYPEAEYGAPRTVVGYEGEEIAGGYALKPGASGRLYEFMRDRQTTCPANHAAVYKNIGGVNFLVRCKPPTVCPAGQEMSMSSGQCSVPVPDIEPTPQSCKAPAAQTSSNVRFAGLGNPIYPLTGVKVQQVATGVGVGGAELVFTYDTSRMLSGLRTHPQPALGALWSSSLHKTLGVGSGAKVVTAYRGDGSVVAFALVNGAYVPPQSINDRLVAVAGGWQYVNHAAMQVESYNAQGQLTRVDAADGSHLLYTYSTAATAQAPDAGYLMQVTDNMGRSLKFEYALPVELSPVYAATLGLIPASKVYAATLGRITRVTDSTGRSFTVAHNTYGVAALTWPDGKSQQFLYEQLEVPWALTGRMDENNVRVGTWSYDAQGRAISASRALGVDAYSVSYDQAPQYSVFETEDTALKFLYRSHRVETGTITVVSPNGQTLAWTPSPVLGRPMLATATQPAGSGCMASSSAQAYDAVGNVLSRDDFAGQRVCHAYDASNRETVRVEGLATTVACAGVIGAGASLPAGSRKITTSWHADWRLPVQVNEPLKRTTTVYHGQPDPFNGGAAASCTSAANLPNGKPRPLACKRVEQALTAGGVVDGTVPTNITSYTYDAGGRLLTSTDVNNRTTTYAYYTGTAFTGTDPDAIGHTAGDLQSVTNPAGHVTQYTQYDKTGRLRQGVDARGVVTDIVYTARGWVESVAVTPPGGTARLTSYSHDDAGQRTGVSLPDGTSLGYSYDAAQRLTGITDTRGNAITYTLDTAGNRIAEEVRDPGGSLQRAISRSFDALNRLQQVSGAAQ
jgi:YD repeat-containing protein